MSMLLWVRHPCGLCKGGDFRATILNLVIIRAYLEI